jgi:hypothetical protein
MYDNTPQNIPHQLKHYDNWVLHRAPEDKKPRQPNGAMALANTPSTWCSWVEAIEALETGNFTGLGWEFSNEGFICFDLDHCLENGVIIDEQAARIVQVLDSYTEISSSGDGLHVIINAEYPAINRKLPGCEVWNQGKYVALTGNIYQGQMGKQSRTEIRTDVRNETARLIDELVQNKNTTTSRPQVGAWSDLDIDVDIEAAMELRCNKCRIDAMMATHQNFSAMWTGTGDYADASSADLALASILADAGLSEQEIANWVSARRMNVNAPQNKDQRLDYLQRTVHKALQDKPVRELQQRRREATETVRYADTLPQTDEAREEVRKAFSTMLGVPVAYIVQQGAIASTWYIKFADEKQGYLKIGPSTMFRSRERWLDLVMEYTNDLPALPAGRGSVTEWNDMLRGIRRHLVITKDDTDDTMRTRIVNYINKAIAHLKNDSGDLRETMESLVKDEAIAYYRGKLIINVPMLFDEMSQQFKGNKDLSAAEIRTALKEINPAFHSGAVRIPGVDGPQRRWLLDV